MFNVLYVNRLQHEGKKLEQKKESKIAAEQKKNTFKPTIAQTSEQLAL